MTERWSGELRAEARRLGVELRGVVVATVIVVTAFGAVSEIVLPLLFAAVLAVVFKPVVGNAPSAAGSSPPSPPAWSSSACSP